MDLIYIKHPHQDKNIAQENILASCEATERESHALLFNYGNAAFRYHDVEPTRYEHILWRAGLPEREKKEFENKSFEECKNLLSLKRFSNEFRDIGMDAFIKELLKPEDFEAIKKIGFEEIDY